MVKIIFFNFSAFQKKKKIARKRFWLFIRGQYRFLWLLNRDEKKVRKIKVKKGIRCISCSTSAFLASGKYGWRHYTIFLILWHKTYVYLHFWTVSSLDPLFAPFSFRFWALVTIWLQIINFFPSITFIGYWRNLKNSIKLKTGFLCFS